MEQLFILRNIVEQWVEWQASHYVNVFDFERLLTWLTEKFMESYEVVQLTRQTHSNGATDVQDTECAVMDEGQESESFNVKTGVRQGGTLKVGPYFIALRKAS